MPLVVHRGGREQHVAYRAVMIIVIHAPVAHLVMIVVIISGQDLHELNGHALRAKLEQQAAADSGRHVAGRDGRPQQQRDTDQQHRFQADLSEFSHCGKYTRTQSPEYG
jgi:hypothetical protein